MAENIGMSNILGERGVRYKRNVLAANLVATVILWAGTSLGDVSVFGVSLAKSNIENRDAAAWSVLFAILGYQWIMLTYYALTDWRMWRHKIVSEYNLPLRALLLGPRVGMKFLVKPGDLYKIEKISSDDFEIRWQAKGYPSDGTQGGRHDAFLPLVDLALIKRRFLAFVTIEFGLPFIWGLTCLALALGKMFG